jgi:thiol-disulfide isomerase/thioredoxin
MKLMEFYGKECPHCVRMMPMVEQLEKELGVTVEKYETWHDVKNEELRRKYDEGEACGGVPFFVNEETGARICGAVSYDDLKAWAGKKA